VTVGADQRPVASLLTSLASLRRVQKDYQVAQLLYQRALPVAEKAFGPTDPFVANMLAQYAGVLRHVRRKRAAAIVEQRAKTILAGIGRVNPAAYTMDVRDLGRQR